MRWNVPVPELPFSIDHTTHLMCIGSCFADEIGKRMQLARFSALVNPRGILFDPITVARAIEQAISKEDPGSRIVENSNMFYSLDHHGDFTSEDRSALLEQIRHSDERLQSELPKTNVLLVSFGTSVAWVWNEDELTVANCHKIPQSLFHRKEFTYEEILEVWRPLVCALREENSQLEIVISVSPVRYFKGDPLMNSRSKAHLVLAANELAKEFDCVHYFPAYELLLDDLRDYRFYKDDLRHPSELAVSYIWDAFQQATMQADVRSLSHKLTKMGKALSHRPKARSQEEHSRSIREIHEAQQALITAHYKL